MRLTKKQPHCIYFSRSITRLLASSIFRLLNLMYMSVTVATLCPNASAIVSFGVSISAASVAHVWRAKYSVSQGRKALSSAFIFSAIPCALPYLSAVDFTLSSIMVLLLNSVKYQSNFRNMF